MVVFLHGYGADGQNLLALGQSWAHALPDTLFIAPDAPTPCEMGGGGFQWFSLDDNSLDVRLDYLEGARNVVISYLRDLSNTYGIPLDKIIIVGFSQGGMIAMDIMYHGLQTAGFISYSGAFYLNKDAPKPDNPSPLLVIHGELDTVLPITFHHRTVKYLQELAISFEEHTYPDLDHSINFEGADRGLTFIQKCLSGAD